MPQYEQREEMPPAALPRWEGPELAMAKIHDLLEQIKFALQPPRPDIIDRSAEEALKTLHMLERFWHGQPPGSYLRDLRELGREPRERSRP